MRDRPLNLKRLLLKLEANASTEIEGKGFTTIVSSPSLKTPISCDSFSIIYVEQISFISLSIFFHLPLHFYLSMHDRNLETSDDGADGKLEKREDVNIVKTLKFYMRRSLRPTSLF